MGSVLARLFRPDPQDVWIKLSKPVLDKYFESVQLSDEKLIHQAALVNFHFEEDPTLPREYLRVMTDCTLQSTWNFGMITEQVSFMGDHFNFSFSPRSSLLLHTFNISISQVQGTFRMEERYFDAPVTIGFRPLWQDWESNGRTLWNRYYLDYFVHFQRPIQLNFRSLSRTLLNHTFVSCVHHGLNTLHLVQYFNSFRSSPELSMLMHIPMTRDQRRAVENWNFPGDTPWYIVIEAARSRL